MKGFTLLVFGVSLMITVHDKCSPGPEKISLYSSSFLNPNTPLVVLIPSFVHEYVHIRDFQPWLCGPKYLDVDICRALGILNAHCSILIKKAGN